MEPTERQGNNTISKSKAQNAQSILGDKYSCLDVTTCGIERDWEQMVNFSIPRIK